MNAPDHKAVNEVCRDLRDIGREDGWICASVGADIIEQQAAELEKLRQRCEELEGVCRARNGDADVLGFRFRPFTFQGRDEVTIQAPSGNIVTVGAKGRLENRILYELGKAAIDRAGGGES